MADEQVPSIRHLSKTELLKHFGNSGTEYWSGYFSEEPNAKWRDEQRVETVEEMRRSDASIRAVLYALKTPILSTEVSIIPASEDKQDIEIAEMVEYQLFNMRRSFQAWLREALSFLDFGHYVFEKIWIRDGDKIRLIDMEPRIPHSIQQWEIGDREKGITQRVRNNIYDKKRGGWTYQEFQIPVEKLFILTNEQEGDDVTGISILRAAYTHYYIKTRIYRIQAVGIERGSVGVPVGEYPEGAGQADKDDFEASLGNLRANDSGYILHKPGYKIELLTPQNNPMGSTIKEAVDHHSRMILLSVLAEFLDLGAGNTGSFALSKDQSGFFLQHLQEKADYIAEQINGLIKEIVDLNYTGVKEYPTFSFSPLGSVQVKELSEMIDVLTKNGYISPEEPQMQDYIRKTLRLPEQDEDLVIENPNEQPAKEEKSTQKTGDDKGEQEPEVEEPESEEVEKEKKLAEQIHNLNHDLDQDGCVLCLSQKKKFEPWRKLTLFEERAGVQAINEQYNEIEESLEEALTDQARADLERSMATLHKRIEENDVAGIAALTLLSVLAIKKILQEHAKRAQEAGKKAASRELSVERPNTPLLDTQLANLEAEQVAEAFVTDIDQKAKQIAREGILKGVSAGAIAVAVANEARKRASGMITNITGTLVGEHFNVGRRIVFDKHVIMVKAFQRSEVLDSRTCNVCLSLDKRIINADEPFAKLDLVHSHCRGFWVPILQEEEITEPIGIPKTIQSAFDTVGGAPVVNSFTQLKKPINKSNEEAQREIARRLASQK